MIRGSIRAGALTGVATWMASRLHCCALPLLAALLLLAGCSKQTERAPGLNVILFVIDTLRADRLSIYGYPRNTTPNLDAFAREGLLFERVSAPAPQTAPSHATLFTSTHPASHGVWNQVPLATGEEIYPSLAPEAVTLAEVLAQNGYQAVGIADGGWLIPRRGLTQGFEDFDSRNVGVENRMDLALEWLDTRSREHPFFLFLHTYEVHTPYMPPEGYEDRFGSEYEGPLREALAAARAAKGAPDIENPLVDLERRYFEPLREQHDAEDLGFLRDLYDAELTLVDEQFARLMAYLRCNDLLDDTLVVVTADHGEEFAEHGAFEHTQVYQPLIHIPLLIRAPGGPRGARRSDFVELLDVMPSILAFLGIEPPPAAVGRVLDFTSAIGVDSVRTLISESNALEAQAAVRRGELKAIFHEDAPERVEVFHLEEDPSERADLAESPKGKAFVASARQALAAHREAARRHREKHGLEAQLGERSGFTSEQLDALRALGYIDD